MQATTQQEMWSCGPIGPTTANMTTEELISAARTSSNELVQELGRRLDDEADTANRQEGKIAELEGAPCDECFDWESKNIRLTEDLQNLSKEYIKLEKRHDTQKEKLRELRVEVRRLKRARS